MFSYEFERAQAELEEAAELFQKAQRLRNPGSFARFLMAMTGPIDSDESYLDRQRPVDEEREDLLARAKACVDSAGSYISPVADWFHEHGLARTVTGLWSYRSLMNGNITVENIQRFVRDLRELQTLTELAEEAEEIAREEETSLRKQLEKLMRERGVHLNLRIE